MTLNLQESRKDWLVCECGNSPLSEGFYCCKPNGKIVSPSMTNEKWDEAHVVCVICNSIYNQEEMSQTGTVTHPSIIYYNKDFLESY